jgi:hypothetical protein
MAGSTTGSWWQYSRWVKNVARNARITEPTGVELTAYRTFLKAIWNPVTQTGTRKWLDTPFNLKATAAAGTADYQCDIDAEPVAVIVELVELVGRDLKKIPMTDVEKGFSDTLIAATGNRRYGTGPLFGGVGGSTVGIP